jgi:nitrile hydratase accessory protein
MTVLDTSGAGAPPRRNGELVFDEPWHARAFGLCVAVLEREGLGWDAFRPHLVAAIHAAPDAEYYDAFGAALDAFLTELGLTSRA